MGETPSVDEGRLRRFLEEAQVTGQLDHPGVVLDTRFGLVTLAAARYRLGSSSEALEVLSRFGEARSTKPEIELTAKKAFEAMSHFRLGDTARAGLALAQLRVAMTALGADAHPDNRALLGEVEELLRGR